jgi:hypothetical protein
MSWHKNKLRWIGVLLLVLVAVGLYWLWATDPLSGSYYPKCWLKSLTHINCAACGSGRATYSLLHLDLMAAIRQNVLYVALLPLLVYQSVRLYADWFWQIRLPLFEWKNSYSVGLLVVAIVFMLLRNLPFYPFTLLFPFGRIIRIFAVWDITAKNSQKEVLMNRRTVGTFV